MSDKTYNGWSNYETWVVKLWMDNEEGSYNYWLDTTAEMVKQGDRDSAINNIQDALKSEHEESLPELKGFAADLLNAAMSEVDWREIATSLVDDYIADNPDSVEEAS